MFLYPAFIPSDSGNSTSGFPGKLPYTQAPPTPPLSPSLKTLGWMGRLSHLHDTGGNTVITNQVPLGEGDG